MAAGGPAPNAILSEMTIERSAVVIWSGAQLAQAMAEGRTMDHLGIRAGDQIIIGQEGQTDFFSVFRTVTLALSFPSLILALVQLF